MATRRSIKPAAKKPSVQPHVAVFTDSHNANRGTALGRALIRRSFEEAGGGRSIVVDKNGKIIGGNKSYEAAAALGLPIRIVESDGKELIVHKRTDLDLDDPAGKARKLAYYDNTTSMVDLDFDDDVMALDVEAGLDLEHVMGLDVDLPPDDGSEPPGESPAAQDGSDPAGKGDVVRSDLPDAQWITDNEYDIPLLAIGLQADVIDRPVTVWGATPRKSSRISGTLCFYTEDYRYSRLLTDPTAVVNSKVPTVVEPNLSCYGQTSRYEALHRIGQKRTLARLWQSYGIRVIVDLNVHPRYYADNLLGVPVGWKAYATRGYSDRLHQLDDEFELGAERAGTRDILFLVYGGGRDVAARCKERAWLWVAEDMDRAKGVAFEYDGGHDGQSV